MNLIDLDRLDPDHIDSSLQDFVRERQSAANIQQGKKRCRLLVNIDYAFGRQAGEVLCCLLLLFGKAIRSVNVLGKAGGLQGKRGDIILATHLILQEDDSITEVRNEGLSVQKLRSLAGGRDVWPGGYATPIECSPLLRLAYHLGTECSLFRVPYSKIAICCTFTNAFGDA